LVDHILSQLASKNGENKPSIDTAAIEALRAYAFPGNVRELENILERAMTWSEGHLIQKDDLMLPSTTVSERAEFSSDLPQINGETDLESHLEDQERQLIVDALESTRWNKTAAAKKLGISFRSLRYKLKKLALD
jgi:two-component system response regulator PilR (NtrC family)